MKKSLFITLSLLIVLTACQSMNPQQKGSDPIDHTLFDELLKRYVNNEGWVDYRALQSEGDKLNEYLKLLEENGPNDQTWTKDEQLTYWINAYNAFTIRLILDYYPVASIKDIGSAIQIPLVNTAWDIKFIEIGDQELSLNNIEHSIIRKNFDEPRIHFALVCAARSCPKLRNEAYDAARLEQQLTDQARTFLANPDKNRITKDEMELSKIFSWYQGDFTKEGSLVEYLNQYAPVTIHEDARKTFKKYDWSLNEQ